MARPLAMMWMMRCWIPEKHFTLFEREWGRRRKGREEDGEGEEVHVTYPIGEAWCTERKGLGKSPHIGRVPQY